MNELIVIFSEYLLLFLFYRNSAITAIEEIKTNFKFFPKYYSLPPRWLRNFFKLPNSEVPTFLHFRLWISFIHLCLAFLASIIHILTMGNTAINSVVVAIILFTPCVFGILDTISFCILFSVFNKRK